MGDTVLLYRNGDTALYRNGDTALLYRNGDTALLYRNWDTRKRGHCTVIARVGIDYTNDWGRTRLFRGGVAYKMASRNTQGNLLNAFILVPIVEQVLQNREVRHL